MKTTIVLLIARLASFAVRLSGRGSGSALPGLIVERLHPQFLEQSLKKLSGGIVLVTGTNGKTTTTKMIVELLEQHGVRVLTNKSGSNFTRGILSMLVRYSTVSGKLPFDMAVLEMDEAYARLIAQKVSPKMVVALNVHRDQLDRYGELNTTANMIGEAMKEARFAVVNGNDPLLVRIAQDVGKAGPTVGYFGADNAFLSDMPTDDELHGATDAEPAKHPPLLVELSSYSKTEIGLKINDIEHSVQFSLPGIYNAVNAAAAVMTVIELLPEQGHKSVVTSLANLHPAFGRGESFMVEGKRILFGLVKNPSGFNHNLKTMVADASSLLIAINDDYADGRDVSWLWDVHFDKYRAALRDKRVMVAGVRADDMILRLDQDSIEAQKLDHHLAVALDQALEGTPDGGTLVVLPTYTAMLGLRGALAKKTKVADIW